MVKQIFNETEINSSFQTVYDFTESLGEIGQNFNRSLREAGTTETFSVDNSVPGFIGYLPNPNAYSTFDNCIVYPSWYFDADCSDFLFSVRSHEGIHALQYQNAALLHVFPHNPDSNIALSPWSFIESLLLMEYDAYAKQAMMVAYAMDDPDLHFGDEVRKDGEAFKRYFDENQGDLVKSLHEYSIDFMRNFKVSHFKLKKSMSMLNLNASEKIRDYGEILRQRPDRDNIIFVHLTAEDYSTIGESYGPNFFADEDMFSRVQKSIQLPYKISDRIKKLNHVCKIGHNKDLMTFTEGLKMHELSNESLLEQTIGQNSFANQPINNSL